MLAEGEDPVRALVGETLFLLEKSEEQVLRA
jgi:hypothetical protein